MSDGKVNHKSVLPHPGGKRSRGEGFYVPIPPAKDSRHRCVGEKILLISIMSKWYS